MRSVFYNDLNRFDLHKLKWYPIELKSGEIQPSSRMNAAMVIKQGIVYVYGGLKELDEKKQVKKTKKTKKFKSFVLVYIR